MYFINKESKGKRVTTFVKIGSLENRKILQIEDVRVRQVKKLKKMSRNRSLEIDEGTQVMN